VLAAMDGGDSLSVGGLSALALWIIVTAAGGLMVLVIIVVAAVIVCCRRQATHKQRSLRIFTRVNWTIS